MELVYAIHRTVSFPMIMNDFFSLEVNSNLPTPNDPDRPVTEVSCYLFDPISERCLVLRTLKWCGYTSGVASCWRLGDIGGLGDPSRVHRSRAPVGGLGTKPPKAEAKNANLKDTKPSYSCTFYVFCVHFTLFGVHDWLGLSYTSNHHPTPPTSNFSPDLHESENRVWRGLGEAEPAHTFAYAEDSTMIPRFDTIPLRDRWTDRQIFISI